MNQKWNFEKTDINGLIKITPFAADDIRGAFIKDYSAETFAQNGITHDLKEVFYTVSHKGVIRAIHFQREKQQTKLVRCVSGKIQDVVVDLRPLSPTYKKWNSFILSEENKEELLIPGGCGHGYLVLEPSIVSYKCNEKFYGEYDDGIIWNDSDLAVEWQTSQVAEVILADKDKQLQIFKEFTEKYGGLT
jgi:dTDP-4-dehydrorhamnose 3,5-epimerase